RCPHRRHPHRGAGPCRTGGGAGGDRDRRKADRRCRAAGRGPGHHHGKQIMALLQNPEFWVAIGFVIMIGVLLRAGAPKMIAKILDDRAAVIAAELAQARKLREEAAALLADYRAKAGAAEKEAEAIITEARAEAARFAEE